MLYYAILTVILTISSGTYLYINRVLKKYKTFSLKNKLSGFEIAKVILDNNNCSDIYIIENKNSVTEEYDYQNKVIRLSTNSFHGENIISSIKSSFIANYAIDKDNTSVKFNDVYNLIINICSLIGIVSTIIGIFIRGNLLYGGILLLGLVFIIEIISLLLEFKNSENTINSLLKYKLITKKEQNDVQEVLNVYRFKNLTGIVTSLINFTRSITK